MHESPVAVAMRPTPFLTRHGLWIGGWLSLIILGVVLVGVFE